MIVMSVSTGAPSDETNRAEDEEDSKLNLSFIEKVLVIVKIRIIDRVYLRDLIICKEYFIKKAKFNFTSHCEFSLIINNNFFVILQIFRIVVTKDTLRCVRIR